MYCFSSTWYIASHLMCITQGRSHFCVVVMVWLSIALPSLGFDTSLTHRPHGLFMAAWNIKARYHVYTHTQTHRLKKDTSKNWQRDGSSEWIQGGHGMIVISTLSEAGNNRNNSYTSLVLTCSQAQEGAWNSLLNEVWEFFVDFNYPSSCWTSLARIIENWLCI